VSTVKVLQALIDKRDVSREPVLHCNNLIYLFQICGADLGYRMQWYNKAWSPDLSEAVQDYRQSKRSFDEQVNNMNITPKGNRVVYTTKLLLHSNKYEVTRWAHILVNTHYTKHVLWTGKTKNLSNTIDILGEYTDITPQEVRDAWKKLRSMGLIDTIAYGKR
jgi:hypothetical protein